VEAPDDRLLPGESSISTDTEDIAHWMSVYSELVDFLQRPELEAVAEVRGRYERRLEFWRNRFQEVGGKTADARATRSAASGA
jgi:hypothetical protein